MGLGSAGRTRARPRVISGAARAGVSAVGASPGAAPSGRPPARVAGSRVLTRGGDMGKIVAFSDSIYEIK
eukprot:5745824-Prymnesium_polylepis.2